MDNPNKNKDLFSACKFADKAITRVATSDSFFAVLKKFRNKKAENMSNETDYVLEKIYRQSANVYARYSELANFGHLSFANRTFTLLSSAEFQKSKDPYSEEKGWWDLPMKTIGPYPVEYAYLEPHVHISPDSPLMTGSQYPLRDNKAIYSRREEKPKPSEKTSVVIPFEAIDSLLPAAIFKYKGIFRPEHPDYLGYLIESICKFLSAHGVCCRDCIPEIKVGTELYSLVQFKPEYDICYGNELLSFSYADFKAIVLCLLRVVVSGQPAIFNSASTIDEIFIKKIAFSYVDKGKMKLQEKVESAKVLAEIQANAYKALNLELTKIKAELEALKAGPNFSIKSGDKQLTAVKRKRKVTRLPVKNKNIDA